MYRYTHSQGEVSLIKRRQEVKGSGSKGSPMAPSPKSLPLSLKQKQEEATIVTHEWWSGDFCDLVCMNNRVV